MPGYFHFAKSLCQIPKKASLVKLLFYLYDIQLPGLNIQPLMNNNNTCLQFLVITDTQFLLELIKGHWYLRHIDSQVPG